MQKLTATAVRNLKPREKQYRVADGGGMALVVPPSGRKWWLQRYRFAGKQKNLSLGPYPAVSLAEARERSGEIKKLLHDGIDPSAHRRAQKAKKKAESTTLEEVADQWLKRQTWRSNYREKVGGRLHRHIFPLLGHLPIAQITPPELLEALRRIEEKGTIETARRCKQHVQRIYRFAIASGLATFNPAAGLEEAMVPRPKPRHLAAVLDPEELAGVLRALHDFGGTTPQMSAALKLLPMLMLRPGELVAMEWREWQKNDTWEIPASKMKMGEPHAIPLPRQAIAILEDLHPWTGNSEFVFPNLRTRKRHITVESITASLRRMGFTGDQVTAHGFRATARTLLDELLGFRPDYIEHQLAHQVKDANRRAYNRTSFLKERRDMMQAWADYLEKLRLG